MDLNESDPYLRIWRNVCSTAQTSFGHPVEECWFLFPASGIGDQMLMLSLLPAFRRHHPGKILVCADQRMKSLLHLYHSYFDGLIFVEGVNVWGMKPYTRFAPGHPYIPWNGVHGDGRLYEFCLDHDISLADLTRHLMHLPRSAGTAPPIVPDSVRAEAGQRFRGLGLVPGKTVILAPVANSIPHAIPRDWWTSVVRLLAAKGLTVALNQRNGSRGFDAVTLAHDTQIPGTVPFDCPLAEVIPLAELAGYHLSARSGISEILSFAAARGKVVYPIGPAAPGASGDGLDWRPSHLGAGGTVGLRRLYGNAACQEINVLPSTTPEEVLAGWF